MYSHAISTIQSFKVPATGWNSGNSNVTNNFKDKFENYANINYMQNM